MKNIKYLLVAFFAVSLILPSFSSAATAEELQVQISALLAQIQSLKAQLAQVQGQPVAWCHNFNANLKVGDTGSEVGNLITALKREGFEINNLEQGDSVDVSFEESIASAVSGFQQKYADEILKPLNLRYGTGYLGKSTRAKLNQLYSCDVKPKPQPFPCPMYASPSPDFCAGGKIVYPEKDENSCFRPPKCILPPSDNQQPVIHGVGGPTTLKSGETGTWVIKAYDPENSPLTYDVNWGDTFGSGASATANLPSQTATFTHSYSVAGTYNPVFTVIDNKGLSAKTSISVNVGSAVVETGAMKITVMWDTGIRCITTPCPSATILYNAKVSVYNEKGSYIGTKDTSGSTAVFENLPVGIYTAIASAEGYEDGKLEFKIVANIGGYLTIILNKKTVVTPSINVLSPNGGETWVIGEQGKITWTTIGIPATNLMTVRLRDAAGVEHYLSYESPNTGGLSFVIPSTLAAGKYTAEVKTAYNNQSYLDASDAAFSIVATTTTPSITVLSPNGGEKWTADSSQKIGWAFTSDIKNINYYLLDKDKNKNSSFLGTLPANQYFIIYQIPSAVYLPAYTSAWIKICDEFLKVCDESNAPFSIVAAGLSTNAQKLDYNNDNVLDLNDTNFLNNVSVGNNQCPANKVCDINKDGKVDISDVILIQRIVLGLDPVPDFVISTSITTAVLSPNGGEKWEIGKTYEIKWSAENIPSTNKFQVVLNKTTGEVYTHVSDLLSSSARNFYWTIPSNITPANYYHIGINLWDTSKNIINTSDSSDAPFSVVAVATTAPNLSISLSSATALSKQVVMGSINNSLATFRFSNTVAEPIKINSLTITSVSSSGYTVPSFANLRIYSGSTMVGGPIEGSSLGNGSWKYVFYFATPPVVTQTSSLDLEVKGDVNSYESGGSQSGASYNFQFTSATGFGQNSNLSANIVGSAVGNAMTVVAATSTPSITVLSPNGGEVWTVGQQNKIQWTMSSLKGRVYIQLLKGGTYVQDITYIDYYSTVDSSVQTYQWQIPTNFTDRNDNDYKIRVAIFSSAGNITDESDAPFSIVAGLSANAQKLDYNNDNVLDLNDTNFLNNVSVGNNQCPANKVCDINKDGKVDISDVILIQRIVLGLDPVPDFNTVSSGISTLNQMANVLGSAQKILNQMLELLKR